MGGWGVRSREAPEDGVAGNTGGSVTGGGGARRASVAGAWNARALSTRDEKRRRLFFRRSATLARSLGSVVAARGLERLRRVTTAKGPGINLPSLVALGLGALPRALRVCLCRSASSAARSSSRSRAERQKIGHATSTSRQRNSPEFEFESFRFAKSCRVGGSRGRDSIFFTRGQSENFDRVRRPRSAIFLFSDAGQDDDDE